MAFCFSVCWYPQVRPVDLTWLRQHCDMLASVPALVHACSSVEGNLLQQQHGCCSALIGIATFCFGSDPRFENQSQMTLVGRRHLSTEESPHQHGTRMVDALQGPACQCGL